MKLDDYFRIMLPAIRDELEHNIAHNALQETSELLHMLRYHMGWEGDGVGPDAEGKRIRPVLTLLCSEAAGGEWKKALPAAAAVELIHNFSLIHDDIEDQSENRRGRETLWKRWGIAQAINTGDLLFSIAHLAIFRLDTEFDSVSIAEALESLLNACVYLTRGQHWDISFEEQDNITVDQYWRMVQGKTATLIGTCCELGAICSPAKMEMREKFKAFGFELGMAFQALDDYLGIWGDPMKTGKSTASDLVRRKKSIPVIYGIQNRSRFAELWNDPGTMGENVARLSELLEEEGAMDFVITQAQLHSERAIEALRSTGMFNPAFYAIKDLTIALMKRSN